MMLKNYFSKDLMLLLLFLTGGGLVSMLLKYEVLWDFANYHYYNPWAFVNNRINYDIAVAGINGFFNPLADIPLYYLIEYFNDYPNLIYFAQGLWFGALGFIIFKIAGLFFADMRPVLLVLLLGLSGYAVFFQIGTSTNEIMISCFLLFSLYLILRILGKKSEAGSRLFFAAGIMSGVALGLKLTAIIYCIGLGAGLIFFYKKIPHPVENILMFALGGLSGFLLIDGFWLWKMWELFGNPLYPYANKIFQSEYFEIRNYTDGRFLPQTWAEYVFWPFYWAVRTSHPADQAVVIDFRWGILSVLAFVAAGKGVALKSKPADTTAFLIVFTVLSYFVWVSFFAIRRYMILLEICGMLLSVKAVIFLVPKKRKKLYFFFISILFLVAMLTPVLSQKWGGRIFSGEKEAFDRFVAVDGVKIPDNTLLMFYNYPSAALLPYFSRTAENIRGVSIRQKSYFAADGEEDVFNANTKWRRKKAEAILLHKGLKVVVISRENADTVKKMLETEFLLKGMFCWQKRSNIVPGLYFCVRPDKQQEIFAGE